MTIKKKIEKIVISPPIKHQAQSFTDHSQMCKEKKIPILNYSKHRKGTSFEKHKANKTLTPKYDKNLYTHTAIYTYTENEVFLIYKYQCKGPK